MSEGVRPELPSEGACAVCGRHIVPAQAKSVETQDYMLFFCGLDCYQKWRNQRDEQTNERS